MRFATCCDAVQEFISLSGMKTDVNEDTEPSWAWPNIHLTRTLPVNCPLFARKVAANLLNS